MSTPLFDPTAQEVKTPIRVKHTNDDGTPATATGLWVHAEHRVIPDAQTGADRDALEVYYLLIGKNGAGAVLTNTFWLRGTADDDASRGVLTNALHNHGIDLGKIGVIKSVQDIPAWAKKVKDQAKPVQLVLEPDPQNMDYSRVKFINALPFDTSSKKFQGYLGSAEVQKLVSGAPARVADIKERREAGLARAAQGAGAAADIPF